jgi:hypothetical protein
LCKRTYPFHTSYFLSTYQYKSYLKDRCSDHNHVFIELGISLHRDDNPLLSVFQFPLFYFESLTDQYMLHFLFPVLHSGARHRSLLGYFFLYQEG